MASAVSIGYVLKQAPNVSLSGGSMLAKQTQAILNPVPLTGLMSGTVNALAKWTSSTVLGSSCVYETSTGQVGIGTAAPTQTFVISGNSAGSANQTGAQIGDVGSGAGPLYLIHNDPQIRGNSFFNAGDFYAGGSGKPAVIDFSNGLHFIVSNNPVGGANSPITDFSEQMTITPNGNVGIGNANPVAKLDVNGGIRVGNTGACSPGVQRYNPAGNGSMEFCDNTGAWKSMGGGALKFGGQYEVQWVNNPGGWGNSNWCWQANPATGRCTCPPGYSGMLVGMTFHFTYWDGAGFVCWSY
jgi:hypothetical protein